LRNRIINKGIFRIAVKYLEDVITKNQTGFISHIIRTGLLLLSWIGLIVVKLRRWLYTKGILPGKKLPCKVISVGNIVVGGSGKTPAVIAIANMLKSNTGLSIGVLSRGYLSMIKGPAVVSDGENILLEPLEAGDEPYLLAQNLCGIPVFIGKDRFRTGSMAFNKWKCQILILDDGFQYLKLSRDMDIITIDATRPFGYEHILPRGYLREPISNLKQAGAIILTRVDQCKNLEYLRARLSDLAPLVPILESIHKPLYLCTSDKRDNIGLGAINNKKILGVCGIANPDSFSKILQSLNPMELYVITFPDHHLYTPEDIEKIKEMAKASKADMIVTTEKDIPKLIHISEYPVLFLKIALEFVDISAQELVEIILKKCDL